MKRKILFSIIFAVSVSICLANNTAAPAPSATGSFFMGGRAGGNPYLPLWERIPDGEPRVFADPDNPGRYRVYLIGSHDTRFRAFCGNDIRVWSAPVEDLTNWRDEGSVFTFQDPQTGNWDNFFAPDMVEVRRFAPEIESGEVPRTPNCVRTRVYYYLFPHSRGPGREGMVARGPTPVGPFVPINLAENGRSLLPGSNIGFDPGIFVQYIDDPNDPNYNIGFRVFGYWGYRRGDVAEIDPLTMWSLVPGTRVNNFIPASWQHGIIYRPDNPFPHVFPGADLYAFNMYEALNIRRFEDKYILIFAGASGPDYGLPSSTSTKRYAFGDSPTGPWVPGGMLIDSRGPVLSDDGSTIMATGTGFNTHGGIQEINGQWYIFFHRSPRNHAASRQAMVAPIKIVSDGIPVAQGGTLRITGYCPFAEDNVWTSGVAADGNHYTGAQLTSEGFQIFGLPPFQYYSAGIAAHFSHPMSLQTGWDMWDDHMPLVGVQDGHRVGFLHFGFGGLDAPQRGLKPFEGTTPGDSTLFNLWLTPRTSEAFTVEVWLDGPMDNERWNGTLMGTIRVPASSIQQPTRFSIPVGEYVEHLTQKNAVFLVVNGGEGNLCDLIGLGFSSNRHQIERFEPPQVAITVNGLLMPLPVEPIRSTTRNGLLTFDQFAVAGSRPEGTTVVAATASDPSVVTIITQPTDEEGALVRFIYRGITKTYRLFCTRENLAAPEADQPNVDAVLQAYARLGNTLTVVSSQADQQIEEAREEITRRLQGTGVTANITHRIGNYYTLELTNGATTLIAQQFIIRDE